MHKLAKGLKKKKKGKKGKKGGEEEEFDREELERYRRERAERAERAEEKAEESGEPAAPGNAGSDEWRKFEALTAGVDSILKKTQGDLDRIKSTSFFQRKVVEEKKAQDKEADAQQRTSCSSKWVGFDEEGNVVEGAEGGAAESAGKEAGGKPLSAENAFVDVPEDEDEQEASADEDIFDTTYVDVLQSIDVQLAYIPDSPVEGEAGDDPFDTTNADKVLKTVDKKGKKLVSLGNAVEILSGRIEHVSTCNLPWKGKRQRALQEDLLLDHSHEAQGAISNGVAEAVEAEKSLLDDDSDLPDVALRFTDLPAVLPTAITAVSGESAAASSNHATAQAKARSTETWKERSVLEDICDLDDGADDAADDAAHDDDKKDVVGSRGVVRLQEADDPFAPKEPTEDVSNDIVQVSFEAATFVNEEDPFDTTFADNIILPSKTELKFIEKELEELTLSKEKLGQLSEPKSSRAELEPPQRDLLGGSTTDLTQLAHQPIAPVGEIAYVDPFDTSAVGEVTSTRTQLKLLERELLGEEEKARCVVREEGDDHHDDQNDRDDDDDDDDDDDGDFDPRKESPSDEGKSLAAAASAFTPAIGSADLQAFGVRREQQTKEEGARPEDLEVPVTKTVAFHLSTLSQADLLAPSEEEKILPAKPLTPYYAQRSIQEAIPQAEAEEECNCDVDPFDTSFVANVAPGRTELKLLECELLKEEPRLSHSLSDHDFDPRAESEESRRKSDFGASSLRPSNLEFGRVGDSLKRIIEQEGRTTWTKQQELTRRESLLDAEVEVDAKPLTPSVQSKAIAEEDACCVDPFDTSIASNILPGKAELKVLESELQEICEQVQIRRNPAIAIVLPTLSKTEKPNARAHETEESKDFLCTEEEDPGAKVLTPLQSNNATALHEEIDPFDTSFAAIGPGKTELKLLESELMQQ